MHEFHWRPGIGDPTVGGWITVGLYALAAVSVLRTLHAVASPSESAFWRGMFFMLITLGINKQLDVQSAITELGRILARSGGWYDQRQTVQAWFILVVAAVCVVLVIVFLSLARKTPAATWMALVGIGVVLAFVLIRSASFHHIDRFIGDRILGLKWNWVLEMGGLSIVLLGAEWRRRPAAQYP